MLLIGVALIVVVFFLKENDGGEDITFAITDTVVWLSVIIGAMIIIISFLGCVGVCSCNQTLYQFAKKMDISLHSVYIVSLFDIDINI